MTTDVVDDFGTGFDGAPGCGGVEGVDGEDGVGLHLEDGFHCGKNAGLLFVGREWSGIGTGGFAADVEDVGSFFEHLEGLGYGAIGCGLWSVEVAAVGK